MKQYIQDVFYNTDHLTIDDKIQLCRDGYGKCYEWWIDKLDCSISWGRQKIEMSLDDILKKLDNSCHFVVIHRKGYEENKDIDIWKWNLEIGFCTMENISHYLWIKIEETEIPYFINKYKLTPR